jgi:hypothetical protein
MTDQINTGHGFADPSGEHGFGRNAAPPHDAVLVARGQDPQEAARQEGRRAIDTAVLRMARAAGAEIHKRHPFGPDSGLTVDYADPAAGIRFAAVLRDCARQEIREYIKYARQEGLTWEQVGEALNLGPVAEERGAWIAEVAFDYAANAERARLFETLMFAWTCPACGGTVLDRGPGAGHPEDDEPGQMAGCRRLAAAVAEYDARWADE